MLWLRQSTASQEIILGRFVDSTDGNTEETGLSIANTDIKLWVEGATTLASKNSGGATHIANGLYYAVLDATDTATLGKMEVHVHVAGALAIKREYMVLSAMIYDSLVLGTDRFDANVTHVADTSQTAGDLAAMITAVDDFVDTEVTAIKTKTDFLPSATAGAAGGLLIAGSNAATTFASQTITGALTIGDGIAVTCSTSNRAAMTLTGNGTGNGLTVTGGSGATSAGVAFSSGASVIGYGMTIQGSGSLAVGLQIGCGATGNAVALYGGTTSGDSVQISATNGDGIQITSGGSNYSLRLNTGILGDITGNLIGTVSTVTTLTTLPTIPANWLTAAGTAADFGTEIGTAVWANVTRTLSTLTGLTVDTVTNVVQLGGSAISTSGSAGLNGMGETYSSFSYVFARVNEIGNNVITANSIATDAGTEIGTAVWANAARTLTSLPTIPTDWITGTGVAASAVTKIQDGLATSAALTVVLDDVVAIKVATDLIPANPADQDLVDASILAAWTTTLTESYAVDGTVATPAQILHMIWSLLANKAIAGTTLTAKKLDGTTTSMTFTLDDSVAPTSLNRAS